MKELSILGIAKFLPGKCKFTIQGDTSEQNGGLLVGNGCCDQGCRVLDISKMTPELAKIIKLIQRVSEINNNNRNNKRIVNIEVLDESSGYTDY